MSSTSNEPTSDENLAPAPAVVEHADGPSPEARFEAARSRLRAALDALDAAINRQTELAEEQADQMAEYDALQEDRSRLAIELDAAMQRARTLEAASGEASRRIERATAAVRAVLAADSSRERSADARATAAEPHARAADAAATPSKSQEA